ncbi:hypothetical protein LC593_09880 [Nostoc sp. CHAB 5844]|nr:hypothetical protein [Nostoc sp. CHAB 5844]
MERHCVARVPKALRWAALPTVTEVPPRVPQVSSAEPTPSLAFNGQ